MTMTPPTLPDSNPGSDGRDATWPGWIGGFAIGLSALGMFGACCGGLSLASGSALSSMAGMEMPAPPRIVVVSAIASLVPVLALAVYQLLGGVATLRRKRHGPGMLIRYAAFTLVLTALVAPLTFLTIRPGAEWSAEVMHAQLDAMEENGAKVTPEQRDEAESAREVTAWNYVWAYGWSAVGLVFPVVLLTFLRRPDVRGQWESWEA